MPEEIFGVAIWKILGWFGAVVATLFNVGVAVGAWKLRKQVRERTQEQFRDETAGTFNRIEDRIRQIEALQAEIEVLRGRVKANSKWTRLLIEEVVRSEGLSLRGSDGPEVGGDVAELEGEVPGDE